MNRTQLQLSACLMIFLGLFSTPIFAQQSGVPQKKPQFPGGLDSMVMFLSRNVKYPPKAKAEMLEGIIMLVLQSKKNGTISSIEVKKRNIRFVKKMKNTTIQSRSRRKPQRPIS
ncbi:MAG: hypothetical protein HC817_04740 [Saprospiraceae bacterium]|nr:hypothetical protein [Saprospiraceae bacterium]